MNSCADLGRSGALLLGGVSEVSVRDDGKTLTVRSTMNWTARQVGVCTSTGKVISCNLGCHLERRVNELVHFSGRPRARVAHGGPGKASLHMWDVGSLGRGRRGVGMCAHKCDGEGVWNRRVLTPQSLVSPQVLWAVFFLIRRGMVRRGEAWDVYDLTTLVWGHSLLSHGRMDASLVVRVPLLTLRGCFLCFSVDVSCSSVSIPICCTSPSLYVWERFILGDDIQDVLVLVTGARSEQQLICWNSILHFFSDQGSLG